MTGSSVGNTVRDRTVPRPSDAIRLRRLLCAIDLSGTSAAALDSAADLARACGAEITALFVLPAIHAGAADCEKPPLFADPGVRTTVARDAEEFVRGARAVATVNVRIEVGDPAAEILATARDTKADAIVMGTHGRSGIERWLLGSVAQKVLRGASCPVLTVSAPRPGGPASSARGGPILCALDLADEQPLRYALYLGRATGRPLSVVHVIEDPWQYEDVVLGAQVDWDGMRRQLRSDVGARLEQALRSEGEPCQPIERLVIAGKPYREILQLAEERSASLIVVGRQGPADRRGALFGSNAERLMRGAKCPVLTVRSP